MTYATDRARALSGADLDVSLLARDQYFREIAWIEPLSYEEQDKLLRRVLRGNAERLQPCPNQWILSLAKHARECLVEVYQPLVVAIARRRRFLLGSMELLDVIQEGNLGLLRALDEYDEKAYQACSFPTVAMVHIKQALSAVVRDRGFFIRLPVEKQAMLTRKTIVESQLRDYLGRSPSLAEVAEMMDVSEETLQQVLDLSEGRTVGSLHALIESREIAEDRVSFTSLYASAVVSEDARQQELAATFQHVLASVLPEQQREILELSYGFGDAPGLPRPHVVIAEMMGVGESQIHGQEKRAIKRLVGLLEPVVMADGRLSCTFHDVYTDEYCTLSEAAALLDILVSQVKRCACLGLLPGEKCSRPHTRGQKEWVFKKADVIAFKQQLPTAPIKLASRRRDHGLKQARLSALLPSVVA